MFTNNIRTLYLYVVSFLALMAIIFGTVNLVEKITNYLYPVNYNYEYKAYPIYDENGDVKPTTTAEDILNRANEEKNAQNRTLREIFTSIAVLLVAGPLYNYHWAMAQKERKKEEV